MIHAVEIKLRLISVGYRHIFVYFYDYLFSRFYDSPHIGYLRSQVEVSVFIHRSDLEHSDVYVIVIVGP